MLVTVTASMHHIDIGDLGWHGCPRQMLIVTMVHLRVGRSDAALFPSGCVWHRSEEL